VRSFARFCTILVQRREKDRIQKPRVTHKMLEHAVLVLRSPSAAASLCTNSLSLVLCERKTFMYLRPLARMPGWIVVRTLLRTNLWQWQRHNAWPFLISS